MKLSDFNYDFPKELVAQRPLPERDASRMMVISRASKEIVHSTVGDICEFLQRGDLLVANDSMVVPARLFGRRSTGEKIELLVVEPAQESGDAWRCLIKRARRIRIGEKFFFGMQSTANVSGRDGSFVIVEFTGKALELAVRHHGVPPLPPYIDRDGFDAYTAEDRERYQTIYAKRSGSAAAPTAGLHVSERLMEKISAAGIGMEYITLHVGIDTFAPVRADDTDDHRMHGERVEVFMRTADAIAKAKADGRRVIAIGTTVVRTLESAVLPLCKGEKEGVDLPSLPLPYKGREIRYGRWTTDLFIRPGFEFRAVDAMLTNFHQPKSTLLMMVSAFAGREFILSCYDEAIRNEYRLFSYGDCTLIL